MKEQRQSKLMRMTIFVGVAAGLALGSSVAVAQGSTTGPLAQQQEEPFEEQTDDPMEVDETEGVQDTEGFEETEGVEGAEDTEGFDDDTQVADEDEVDYPGDIEDFAEFIREHQEERIESVSEYTEEGANLMVDAMEEVIPGESGWFTDRPEEYQPFEDDLEAWEDRLDELSDHEREDFAQVTADVLNEGADWINSLQASAYPELSEEANAVSEAANEIDGTTNINEQEQAIEGYFVASLTAIQAMYRSHDEDPVTRHDGPTLAYAVDAPMLAQEDYGDGVEDDWMEEEGELQEEGEMHEEGEMQEEDEMAEEELSSEVQSYSDFVETLDQETLEGEEGERMTVDGLRELEGALSLFIEEDVETLEGDEGAEGAQLMAMESDDDAEMEEEGMEEGEATLSDQRDNLNTYIEDLEASIGSEEFGENLETSVDEAADLLTAIQEEQFPEFEDQANEIREAADSIENAPVGEQAGELIEFFESNRDALEAMDRADEEEPEEPAV